MRAAALLVFVVLTTGPVAAEGTPANGRSAALGVSVRVTRSCEVNVSTGTVGVACGTERPSLVQVTADDGPPSLRILHGSSDGARRVFTIVPVRELDPNARTVTVHF